MKKELWELEGFDSYESWAENEKECTKRGIESAQGFVQSSFEMFNDPECRKILGLDL